MCKSKIYLQKKNKKNQLGLVKMLEYKRMRKIIKLGLRKIKKE